jgi:protein O-mannosyl-transferase
LSALFAFASILCYLFHSENQKSRTKWASICFFVLALLSKPSVVILPGILMLIDQYQKHRMNAWDLDFLRKQITDKAAWIIPAIAAALATIYFQQGGSHGDFMKDAGLLDRLVHVPTRLGYYLYHIFNPTSLSFHYTAPPYDGILLATTSGILLVALTFFAYKIRVRHPLALFALLWFYICIIPMSGVVHVGTSFIADRYTYLAAIGIFACMSSSAIKFIPKHFAYTFFALIAVACAWLAHQQTKVWKDSYALFSNAIEAQPRDAIGYANLGAKYQVDGNLDKARILYGKAIEIAPLDYITHHNLAHIHLAQKQWRSAEKLLLEALEIYENYHPSMKSLSELYNMESELYDVERALVYTQRYNKVVRDRDARMLGVEMELLLERKKYEEAKSVARKLQLLPDLTPQAREFIDTILNSNPSP